MGQANTWNDEGIVCWLGCFTAEGGGNAQVKSAQGRSRHAGSVQKPLGGAGSPFVGFLAGQVLLGQRGCWS